MTCVCIVTLWSDAIATDEIATVHNACARQIRNMNVAHDEMHLSQSHKITMCLANECPKDTFRERML